MRIDENLDISQVPKYSIHFYNRYYDIINEKLIFGDKKNDYLRGFDLFIIQGVIIM